jgi:tetratricopeptide (TPR) repeat protein
MAMNKIKVTKNVTIQGIIGFLIGTCLDITAVGLISVNRAFRALNDSYDLTSTVFNTIDTPTPTPVITATSTPKPKPRDYYYSLEEAEYYIYESPQLAIDTVVDAMKGIYHPLDLAIGNRLIAEAYMLLGDNEQSTIYYEKTIELLEPLIERNISIKDLSVIYYNLIYAFLQYGDYQSGEDYYGQMVEELEPLVQQSNQPAEIGEVYFNLIQTTSYFGDYFSMDSYYSEMKEQLEPLLNKLETIEEIAETYTNLSESAMLCGYGEEVFTYGQEMVEKLKVLRNELTSDEDIIFVNKNLGDVELSLANYQFAAVYFHEVLSHQYTPINIFRLASTYDIAGNHACAYYWYQKLMAIEYVDLSFYQDYVEERIELIEEIYEGQDIPECHD